MVNVFNIYTEAERDKALLFNCSWQPGKDWRLKLHMFGLWCVTGSAWFRLNFALVLESETEKSTQSSTHSLVAKANTMAAKKELQDRDQILLVFVHGFRGSEASFQVSTRFQQYHSPLSHSSSQLLKPFVSRTFPSEYGQCWQTACRWTLMPSSTQVIKHKGTYQGAGYGAWSFEF
jgi:hypothetical protein